MCPLAFFLFFRLPDRSASSLFVRVAVVILDILSAMLKCLLISMPLGAFSCERAAEVKNGEEGHLVCAIALGNRFPL